MSKRKTTTAPPPADPCPVSATRRARAPKASGAVQNDPAPAEAPPTDDRESEPVAPGKPEDGQYEVGFGRPPKASQWRKGQSGNPSGRPPRRRSTSLADITDEELQRTYPVRIGDKTVMMSGARIGIRHLTQHAMKGDLRALVTLQKLQNSRASSTEPTGEGAPDAFSAEDARILDRFIANAVKSRRTNDDPET